MIISRLFKEPLKYTELAMSYISIQFTEIYYTITVSKFQLEKGKNIKHNPPTTRRLSVRKLRRTKKTLEINGT